LPLWGTAVLRAWGRLPERLPYRRQTPAILHDAAFKRTRASSAASGVRFPFFCRVLRLSSSSSLLATRSPGAFPFRQISSRLFITQAAWRRAYASTPFCFSVPAAFHFSAAFFFAFSSAPCYRPSSPPRQPPSHQRMPPRRENSAPCLPHLRMPPTHRLPGSENRRRQAGV